MSTNLEDFALAMNLPDALVDESNFYSVMKESGHVALFSVFSGFGPNGDKCSKLCKSRFPEYVFGSDKLQSDPVMVLTEAFARVQEELVADPETTADDGAC